MKFVATDKHKDHDPQFFLVRGKVGQSAEQPERARILEQAALQMGLERFDATSHERAKIEAIHSGEYLQFLSEASAKWASLLNASPEVTANVHPNRVNASYPRSIVGRAGWHMADTACPIGPKTHEAAFASAHVALTATDFVLNGEQKVYALCRPPGHHAYADMAGGFCFLNNSAIAAEALRAKYQRVVVFDIDVHHGNGTQGIFYNRGDVLTVSIHADPADYYPYFWGYAHEHGRSAGEGANINLPLPLGSHDSVWLQAIEDALTQIQYFSPGAAVIALGLDAHERDPLQGLSVTTKAFIQAGLLIKQLNLPTVVVQEGGYLSKDLGTNLQAFFEGFA